MPKKITKQFQYIFLIISICFNLSLSSFVINAYAATIDTDEDMEVDDSATNGDYDYTQYEELTQSFYIPKSSFTSSYDYEKYCKKMYSYGYMDENCNWTAAATNAINNMNAQNMQKLDENAKQIVQDRIDNGEMDAVDNPYLTYDQKQALIKQQEQESHQQSTGNGSDENGSLIDTEVSVTPEIEISEEPIIDNPDITKSQEEQSNQEELPQEKNKTTSTIGWVVIVLFFTIVAAVAYSIYRRQF